MRAVLLGLVLVLQLGVTSAGSEQPPQPPPAPPKPATAAPPTPPPPPPASPGRVRPAGQNVRVDVTLADQGGSGATPTTKTVTVTTNDGSWGRLRTGVTSRAYGVAPLNVDVRPWVQSNGQVLVELTIEYNQGRNPDADGNADKIVQVSINQSASVLLQDGRSLMLSQSADPIGERKVTVEVKATVLKN